ncbi:SulP family inorganic anion transporter [Zhouia sp. PK063]|uniref:SulP family inorganic anion transporter n=1 Tax=Zhouia sp. PK063 TaxID=3373602 RepID=UPI0037AFFBF9
MNKKETIFAHLKSDFSSGLVVFLVALPLCLGIAMASGAPLFSGIIAGIVGGLVIGALSKSHVSVSGPAAGLTAIVIAGIIDLGGFQTFLLAGLIAGVIQLLLGFIKAGTISNYFPSNVIEGMLAGIGVIIFLKQVPKALGSDINIGSGLEIFTTLAQAFQDIKLGSILIAGISLVVLIGWDKIAILKKIKFIPAALVVVVLGVAINEILLQTGSSLAISQKYLVNLPVPETIADLKSIVVLPNFTAISNPDVWVVGITIAVVASIETLLCIEASDRMDTLKRYTSPNAELKAQGVGNIISALIGGIPMTSVIVRSSANVNSGAKSKLSTIIHGGLLLISILAAPTILNKIPLATLAAILLVIGYRLAKPATFKHFWNQGKYQFIPFIATFATVVFADLLKGVGIGIVLCILFVLKGNLKRAYYFRKEEYQDGDIIHIDLAQEVSFLNKAALKLTLNHLPDDARVIINASDTVYIAHDVLELIREFKEINAPERGIQVGLVGFKEVYKMNNHQNDIGNHVSVEHTLAPKRNGNGSHKEVIAELVNSN